MSIDPRVRSFVASMKIEYDTLVKYDPERRLIALVKILNDVTMQIKQELATMLGCAFLAGGTEEQKRDLIEALKKTDPVLYDIILARYNSKPCVETEVTHTVSQENPQSPINQALRAAAVDACDMLRKWSDSLASTGIDDSAITPYKIGLFQDQLTQRFAEVYFGTHPRLAEIESES